MFDTIRCDYPLPLPDNANGFKPSSSFQTKDFECTLSNYVIRCDGKLWVERVESEYEPGNPKGKTFTEQIGRLKVIKSWWEPVNITRTIEMYDYFHNDGGDVDYNMEYNVTFVDGAVAKIDINNFETFDNSQRKKAMADVKARMKYERNWKYIYIFKYYNKFLYNIVKTTSKVCSFITNTAWKIYHKISI